MLDRNDLLAIQEIVVGSENRIKEWTRGELQKQNKEQREWTEKKFEEERAWTEKKFQEERAWTLRKIRDSENLVLEELDRVQVKLQDEMKKIRGEMSEIASYYRIRKVEESTSDILVHTTEELQEDVEGIKQRMNNCTLCGCG